MLKRSIAINCILTVFASKFCLVSGKKKHFAKNEIISWVQEARICLLVNMAINTLHSKLIWVD